MTTFPLTTTLGQVRASGAAVGSLYFQGLARLSAIYSDNDQITYADVLDSFCFEQVLLCMQSNPEHKMHWRRFALWCAKKVQHHNTDPWSLGAIKAADRYVNGLAGDTELNAAYNLVNHDLRQQSPSTPWRTAYEFACFAVSEEAIWTAAVIQLDDLSEQAQIDALRQLVMTGELP